MCLLIFDRGIIQKYLIGLDLPAINVRLFLDDY